MNEIVNVAMQIAALIHCNIVFDLTCTSGCLSKTLVTVNFLRAWQKGLPGSSLDDNASGGVLLPRCSEAELNIRKASVG